MEKENICSINFTTEKTGVRNQFPGMPRTQVSLLVQIFISFSMSLKAEQGQ